MNCDCIERIDEQLAEQNFALDVSFLLGKDLSMSSTVLSVPHRSKENGKRRSKSRTD